MCVIIAHKIGERAVGKADFFKYGHSNGDGFGLMWVDNNDILQVYKTMKLEELWEKYVGTMAIWSSTSPVCVHFRLGTSGGTNLEMCHPFLVDETVGFMHNGVMNIEHDINKVSDTWQFNESVLKKTKYDIYNSTFKLLIEKNIGSYNKLVFLNNKKELLIMNEDSGEWDGDTWYSFKYKKEIVPFNRHVSVYNRFDFAPGRIQTCDFCNTKHRQDEMITVLDQYAEPTFICEKCINAKPILVNDCLFEGGV